MQLWRTFLKGFMEYGMKTPTPVVKKNITAIQLDPISSATETFKTEARPPGRKDSLGSLANDMFSVGGSNTMASRALGQSRPSFQHGYGNDVGPGAVGDGRSVVASLNGMAMGSTAGDGLMASDGRGGSVEVLVDWQRRSDSSRLVLEDVSVAHVACLTYLSDPVF